MPKRSPSHAMRAKLLYKLMDSLDESPASDTEATWVAEVRRPLALYRAGELKAVPMERAIAELRSDFPGRIPRMLWRLADKVSDGAPPAITLGAG